MLPKVESRRSPATSSLRASGSEMVYTLKSGDASRCMTIDYPQGPAGRTVWLFPLPGHFFQFSPDCQKSSLRIVRIFFSKITAMSSEARPDLRTTLYVFRPWFGFLRPFFLIVYTHMYRYIIIIRTGDEPRQRAKHRGQARTQASDEILRDREKSCTFASPARKAFHLATLLSI